MGTTELDLIGVPFKTDVCLKNWTTFGVGGICPIMFFPRSQDEFFRAIEHSNGNYVVLGTGSNVLVSDEGFDVAVISTSHLRAFKLSGSIVEAECGVKISELVKVTCENSIGGLEFAVGIPGTVGGFVAMNGGCYNKSASDVVCYVKSLSGVKNNSDCKFGYRESAFFDDPIYSVGFKLQASESDVIAAKIERFSQLRKNKQPKGNSCGCVFRNDGYFAGKVIDQAGLKGYRIGGAYVSNEHANFIINDGGNAANIYDLICYVKETVQKRMGIELCEEVKYIGKF